MRLLLHEHASWEGVLCVCSRAALQDTELLNRGMKGRPVEEVVDRKEAKAGRSVSFDVAEEEGSKEVSEEVAEALADPWRELRAASPAGRVVLVEQVLQEPQEEFDIPYKEDVLKMKELGLPLGFLNVSPYEVEEGGVVETPVMDRLTKGKKKGRRKKKRVVDEETRARFDSGWWAEQGEARVMEVWRERYSRFMEQEEEEKEVDI